MNKDILNKILNMTEEETIKMFNDYYETICENYSENEINKDIAENAVKYLKENNKKFENYTEKAIKTFLFGIGKVAEN